MEDYDIQSQMDTMKFQLQSLYNFKHVYKVMVDTQDRHSAWRLVWHQCSVHSTACFYAIVVVSHRTCGEDYEGKD